MFRSNFATNLICKILSIIFNLYHIKINYSWLYFIIGNLYNAISLWCSFFCIRKSRIVDLEMFRSNFTTILICKILSIIFNLHHIEINYIIWNLYNAISLWCSSFCSRKSRIVDLEMFRSNFATILICKILSIIFNLYHIKSNYSWLYSIIWNLYNAISLWWSFFCSGQSRIVDLEMFRSNFATILICKTLSIIFNL